MHDILGRHIDHQLDEAQAFVMRYMPIELEPDQIYEDLLGDPDMAQAFSNAARYMPASNFHKRMQMQTVEYGNLTLDIRLGPTDKYPVFLLPKRSPPLTRESRLSKALALPYRVARDWQMLKFTFNRLQNDVDDVAALALLMPWIRPLVANWKENHKYAGRASKDRRIINREVETILSEKPPHSFPRMTDPLNAVCRSGKTLFSQYRMLEATHGSQGPSPVILGHSGPVPDWLIGHLNEVIADWRCELEGITRQDGSDMVDR